jgi:hypothetical protein
MEETVFSRIFSPHIVSYVKKITNTMHKYIKYMKQCCNYFLMYMSVILVCLLRPVKGGGGVMHIWKVSEDLTLNFAKKECMSNVLG